MKKRYLQLIILSVILLGFIFVLGCASTGGTYQRETPVDDTADIDELLGLTDNDSADIDEGDAIDEDDVLKLLGVVEEGEAANTAPETNSIEQQIKDNEKKIDDLNTRESTLSNRPVTQKETSVSTEESGIAANTSTNQPFTRQPDREPSKVNRRLTFEEKYQDALKDYNAHQFRTAIQKFEDLLMDNSNHQLSDNCQYWIGESYYGLANFKQAMVAFERVFLFTNSNKDDDAQLKLGLCYVRLNDKARAKEEFQKLINNYPTSEYVSIARRYINNID